MRNRIELLVFFLILATAVFFRFYQLNEIPPGLYPDVAMNGNNAIAALENQDYKIFYPENFGREGLFINLQAVSIAILGKTVYALKFPAAVAGVLTVIGLYFLARRLFNWQIAAIASFLMAVSFWHVLFSRIGFRAILAPMLLVWALYFLWRGLATAQWGDFVASGALWGLGAYTYIAFRVTPLILVLVLAAYWRAIKKDFPHDKYIPTRNKIALGVELLLITAIIVALPLGIYFFQHPGDFFGRTAEISVTTSDHPVIYLVANVIKTLGMFTFVGDFNWRHNFAGEPQLFWPIGALFFVGLVRSMIKLFHRRKTHGHYSTTPVLLLAWFFIGLLPTMISNEGLPHALRTIIVAPVAFIFAAEGLWWIFTALDGWYWARDEHRRVLHLPHHRQLLTRESTLITSTVIVIFLFSIAFAEFHIYFRQWARRPEVAMSYNAGDLDIAQKINALPQQRYKYIVSDDTIIRPQTVMYLTDSWTSEKQAVKNIFYISTDQYRQRQYRRDGAIFILTP